MTSKPRLIALASALAAAVVVSMITTAPAYAQTRAEELRENAQSGNTRNARTNRRDRRAGPQQSPEQIMAAAQEQANIASTGCQVTQANLLGQTAEGQNLFEVACATGPGYLIASTTPPLVSDCVLLAAAADATRSRDPEADVGPQCAIPSNLDYKGFIKGYATQAGVTCTVDDGVVVGRAPDSGIVYEIGCAGSDGFHIKNLNGTWTKDECLQVLTQSATCRFTTAEEQAATVKSWLAGSDAAACDVQQARFMGQNANGRFYEAKCAAGDGFIARVNDDRAVQQTYPCATAQNVGGGCTLTPVPAAPSAATTEQ